MNQRYLIRFNGSLGSLDEEGKFYFQADFHFESGVKIKEIILAGKDRAKWSGDFEPSDTFTNGS